MVFLTSLPQKYSRDLYVRMRANEFHQLQLVHLYSEVLVTPPFQPSCGCTEWSGTYRDATISLAWDWVMNSDRALHISRSHGLRTNIMLVCDKGYDLGLEATSAICERFVERIPWGMAVLSSLRNRLH